MPVYRKKPVEVEAHQWLKNGDHPYDNSRTIYPEADSTTQFEPFLSEGNVVRYCRHPDAPGTTECRHCEQILHVHGWIDTLEGGHIVCPGDFIITGVRGEHYPCKPDIFRETYAQVGF